MRRREKENIKGLWACVAAASNKQRQRGVRERWDTKEIETSRGNGFEEEGRNPCEMT